MRIGNMFISITNKKRAFLTLTLLMIILMGFVIAFPLRKVNGEKEQTIIQHTVEAGDTIWSISKKYDTGTDDIRKKVYEICELNDKTNEYIYVGEILQIPID